jgi:hypothetical protein
VTTGAAGAGVVTGVKAGMVTLTVSFQGATRTVPVTVTGATVLALEISPPARRSRSR